MAIVKIGGGSHIAEYSLMKRFGISLATLIAIVCSAQPPPNDYFTNRIALNGPVVTFGGNTTWATGFEDAWEPCAVDNGCGGSVWWSWTAQDSTPVVIERLGEFTVESAGMSIFSTTNMNELYLNKVCSIDLHNRGQYAVFRPQSGKEYVILVGGEPADSITYRLTATNAPIFRLQPRTQTVSPNASVLFTASAVGIKPLLYQWQFAGTNVSDGTNQAFVIHNVSTANQGDYRVIVSNPTGVSTSTVARLVISPNDANPLLSSPHISDGTNFRFTVTGEQGRVYRCETSSDLTNWSGPLWFNTNISTTFSIPNNPPVKFVRISQYHPASEVCNCNLKQIWFGIWQFAEDAHRDPVSPVTASDVAPYCMHGEWPQNPDVPQWGYTILNAELFPTCSAVPWTHILEKQ